MFLLETLVIFAARIEGAAYDPINWILVVFILIFAATRTSIWTSVGTTALFIAAHAASVHTGLTTSLVITKLTYALAAYGIGRVLILTAGRYRAADA